MAHIAAYCCLGEPRDARREIALLRSEWENIAQPIAYEEAMGTVLRQSMPYRDFCVEIDSSVALAVEVGAASGIDVAVPIREALAANGHAHAIAKYATGAALALALSTEHESHGAAHAATWLDNLREEGDLGAEHPHNFFFDVDEYFGERHPFIEGWHALKLGDLRHVGEIVEMLAAKRSALVHRFEEGRGAVVPWSEVLAPKLCWLVRAARESLDPTFVVPGAEPFVWLCDL